MGKSEVKTEEKEKADLTFLLDPTYPLLEQFRNTCPGTNKHAQSVLSMVERISLALNLDTVFLKVAAQYHDIGKMNNPGFFSENQLEEDENPHDTLDPWISSQILSKHVGDGVTILVNDSNFPREIIEIISQHHGTEIMNSCFGRVNQEDKEKEFRYKLRQPTNIESAVLMICDHVDAAARSHFQKGDLNPREVIDSVINKLIDDGQLDEVKMSFGEQKKLKDALAQELKGTYQKRVDYDPERNGKK